MPSSVDLFKKYKNNNIFVETGSHVGGGIDNALSAGYQKIYSIELAEKFYNFCKNKYKNNNKVYLLHGDSSKKLNEILNQINEPVTFFLDGHYSFDNDTAKGDKVSPMMEELNIIGNHHIKNHTIIMDDVRLWEKTYGFNLEQIKEKVLNINKDYKFILEDTYQDGKIWFEKDILIARI